jgi:hypothetical protein
VAGLVALAFLPARAAVAGGIAGRGGGAAGSGSAGDMADLAAGEDTAVALTNPADSGRTAGPVRASRA